MKTNVKWQGVEDIMHNLNTHKERVIEANHQIGLYFAPQMQSYAQSEASWQDQTANARQTLHSEVEHDNQRTVIYLSHGMWYGLMLEIRFAGRYGIVWVTVEHFLPDIRKMLKQTFS